ncbi:MAG: transglycosylase domain-containing protein, partial [Clostridia bacterium]|nr:transglycosylase domain-containing protein [Clostridia bacterium]
MIIGLFTFYTVITINVKLDKEKLVNMERVVSYYDNNGNKFAEESGGIAVTDISKIPTHVKNAFISIEDKRFYEHNGIDYRGLLRATFNNIKSFSFKEGASTISQQLIKNTHLTNEKTLKRKLSEIKLAKELERNYSKEEILEKYLNTIYFGNGCYGITQASNYYFNKTPEFLDVNEGAILAAMIKAPSHYSPITNMDKCFKRKNLVLLEMKNQGYITDSEYLINSNKEISIKEENNSTNINFLTLARNEYDALIKNCPYKSNNFNVYTSFNPQLQQILDEEKLVNGEYDNSNIILNKQCDVVAFQSTCTPLLRQPGSTLKPLLVYAPAIETDTVFSCSPILDEKTDFNGYVPSNYNDNYYGYVSVKESLAKSLNTCAVKILNYVGVDKAKYYLEKTDIKLDESDNSLCLALGATAKGVSLTDLSSSYSVFLNEGNFYSASCINKITADNNEIIYQKKKLARQIFSNETVSILNDMMEYTVTNGTAKKLSYCNIPLYAKTGSVGNKDGNTDAYTISYTSEYILSSWCGGINYGLMNNYVTGGNIPAKQSRNIWKKI